MPRRTAGRPDRTGAPRRRLLTGVALIAAAAVIAYATVPGRPEGDPALIVTRPVPAGTSMAPDLLAPATVSLPDPRVLYPADQPVAGTAARTLREGEPLLAADVTTAPSQDRLVTLPVAPDLMPVGLRVGERVDVWQPGRGTAPVLAGAVVNDVSPADVAEARVELLVPPAAVATAVGAAGSPDLVLARQP